RPPWLLCLEPCVPGEIIGSTESKPHSRPYMISGKSYRCGGFLVREDFVLTAAHCLGRKANVTTAVSPISLPRDWDKVKSGMLCSVAGWGRLGVNMSCPKKLQEVELEVQRAEKCTSRYRYYNTTTQICAGDSRESKSSFKMSSPGDSGGPLVCNGVAQGIVSYAKKDGTPPGIFTRISSFMPWIQKAMK
uniref:Peptidase S1 domain-containing protein n=1 Tax=Capra hircus TaxID=9925 RepID=A0A8C2QXR1_CAPHI